MFIDGILSKINPWINTIGNENADAAFRIFQTLVNDTHQNADVRIEIQHDIKNQITRYVPEWK